MNKMIETDRVGLVEVFSSIQGEGLFVGCRQVFVRLAGCNISCRYCDTRESFAAPKLARIETQPGRRSFIDVANPLRLSELAEYVQAIKALAALRGAGVKLYLETNGTLPAELQTVIDVVDIISLDFKLPSVMGGVEYWRQHAEFLRIAAAKTAFVKVVVSGETTEAEIARSVELIAAVDAATPLILQPVTPANGVCAVDPAKVLLWQEQALQQLQDVRVIPQTHKIMGQL